jgi:DUF1009 family protein
MNRLALIAGQGDLPGALLAALPVRPLICALDGFLPQGIETDQVFRIERLALFLRYLQDQGITDVIFAGAVQRPKLDPSLFDPMTAQLVPRLLAAMQAGDDGALRAVIGIFEETGFAVRGVAEIAPDLIPSVGIFAGSISAQDRLDADRAADIVAAMGAVDIGQGCVVAQGQCLGVEVISGTDAMLASVAAMARRGGVFFKSCKPAQDRRIDLPTLGVQTVLNADAAGLAGIAWRAGEVICLDLPAMQAAATARGMFLWAR